MTTSTEVPLTPGPPPPPPRRRRVRRARALVVLLVALLVLAGLLVLGARAVLGAFDLSGSEVEDYSGAGTGEVVVQVMPGETAADVATTLRDADVVASRGAFLQVANADQRAMSLQPGSYALREQMSAAEAFELLLDPVARVVTRVTVPEGSTVAEALDRITESTEIPREDLEAAVADTSQLGLPEYADGDLEGYLFPATYDVQPGTTAVELLSTMVARFTQEAESLDIEAQAAALGFSAHDVVTVASLIEKEVRVDREYPQVARVVYNRIEDGMPLQFDSTVNYVLPERRGRLSLEDIEIDSPYNTYTNSGLPPTPISAPGRMALQAALEPAEGDYVYFITIDTEGNSLFTADYQEFLRAKAKSQAEGVY